MTLFEFLDSLGLGAHLPAFEAQGIDAAQLATLTDGDLKEIGVLKLGDRKRILAAVQLLQSGRDAVLIPFCETWPSPVALPLKEYLQESHPTVRLWAACDTVELMLRLLVIGYAGSWVRGGGLPEKLSRKLSGVIEAPTLGAWFVMAQALSEQAGKNPGFEAAAEFIRVPLRDLLYGAQKPGTPETSFISLRNRLAHGGGLMQAESARLLGLWQERVCNTLIAAAFLNDWELLGRDDTQSWRRLRGATAGGMQASPPALEGERDSVWLRIGEESFLLWPMALFGKPGSDTLSGRRLGGEVSPQIYSRREGVCLAYTPMGVVGMAQSTSGASALRMFEQWFQIGRHRAVDGFKVPDFLVEIGRDAAQMVGREMELDQARQQVLGREQGVLWISGVAGMGKSFLLARLAVGLLGDEQGVRRVVLPYRFRGGEQVRCSREALGQFVVERLLAAGAMREVFQDQPENHAEKRLGDALGMIRPEIRVILVLDGLDEVQRRDRKFVEEIPLGLRYPRVLWVCAGRDENGIGESMTRLGAERVFAGGLPPMTSSDIRGMILEKIGPLRRRLVAGDLERGDSVVNPFIELVTERAAGLPLYVRYVIGDVLNGKYQEMHGQEELPASLHAYHEELLTKLGVGDLQAVVTPLAATLACAHEPLAVRELEAILVWRKLFQAGAGPELVNRALGVLSSMVSTTPDPEGEEGFTLFHQSLREHILQSGQMVQSVSLAKQAFADMAATQPSLPECVHHYFIRCGVRHLLTVDRKMEAEGLLLDLRHLKRMDDLGIVWTDIYRWWMQLGGEDRAQSYVEVVEEALQRDPTQQGLSECRGVVTLSLKAKWTRVGSRIARRVMLAAESALGPHHPDTLRSVNNLGILLRDKGDYQEAEQMHRRALVGKERAFGWDHPDTLRSVNSLGILLCAKENYPGAEEMYRRALAGIERVRGLDHPETLRIANNLGNLLFNRRKYAEAEEMCRRALYGMETSLGSDHLETITIASNLGILLSDKGDYAGAEKMYRRALGGYEKALGPDHPSALSIVNNLAGLLSQKGYLLQAEEMYRRAWAGYEKALGPDHPDTLRTVNNLGELLRVNGDYTGAEEMCRRALAGFEKTLGPDNPDTLSSISHLGVVLEGKGLKREARELYWRALSGRERALGSVHPATLDSIRSLKNLLLWEQDYEGVENLYRRALATRDKELGRDHPNTLKIVIDLGELYKAEGDLPAALQLLKVRSGFSVRALKALRYNLACYKCLSGKLEDAKLLIAAEIGTAPARRVQALEEDDLYAIHEFIRSLPEAGGVEGCGEAPQRTP